MPSPTDAGECKQKSKNVFMKSLTFKHCSRETTYSKRHIIVIVYYTMLSLQHIWGYTVQECKMVDKPEQR